MVDSQGRDVAHAKELRCLDPSVSGDYFIDAVNQDWTDKSKFCDACRYLPDLSPRMRPRIPCPRLKLAGSL
jgi:hypothetical protein